MNAQAFLLAKMPMVSPEPSQWPPRNSVSDHPACDPQATAKQKTPLSRIYLPASSYCYFACYLEAASFLWLAQPLNNVLGFCSRRGCSLRSIHKVNREILQPSPRLGVTAQKTPFTIAKPPGSAKQLEFI